MTKTLLAHLATRQRGLDALKDKRKQVGATYKEKLAKLDQAYNGEIKNLDKVIADEELALGELQKRLAP